MMFPKPEVGLVVRYSFLWSHEAEAEREEGSKDRPCAIVVAQTQSDGRTLIRVLPVTHSLPDDASSALEIPHMTKEVLGLDFDRSWVIHDEANDFVWPGPDLRPKISGNASSVSFGTLPKAFMKILGVRLAARYSANQVKATRRSA